MNIINNENLIGTYWVAWKRMSTFDSPKMVFRVVHKRAKMYGQLGFEYLIHYGGEKNPREEFVGSMFITLGTRITKSEFDLRTII